MSNTDESPMSKGVQITLASLAVFSGLGWFAASQTQGEGTFRYYSSVADYLARDPNASQVLSLQGERVHGFVVDGSIYQNLPEGYVDFVVRDESEAQLAVRYDGIDIPDLFKNGAEVVVEGRMQESLFVAKKIMAKCPSKYEAKAEEPTA